MHYIREKKKSEEDINNLINNLLIRRKTSFSFASCSALIKVFDRICGAMNKSRSEVINNLIIDFIRQHHERNGQIELTQFFVKAEAGSQVNIAKRQIVLQKVETDPEKEKARRMLTAVLKHVQEGHDLNPKAHEYYVQLAKENRDLKEARELLKRLCEGGPNPHG